MDIILFLSLLLLFSLSLNLVFRLNRAKTGSQNLPPGTTGLPFIGETLEYLSSGRDGHPEKFIRDRKSKYSSDVFKTSIAGETIAILSGPAGNKFLFTNENKHVVSWFPKSVERIMSSKISRTPSVEWSRKFRAFLSTFLTPEAIGKYVPTMDVMVTKLIETDWKTSTGEVKVFTLAKKLTFSLGCQLFLSIDDPDHIARLSEPFTHLVAGFITLPINFPGTAYHRAIKSADFIRSELLPIIKQKRAEIQENNNEKGNDALISHATRLAEENGFTNEEKIADSVLGVLLASYDNVSVAITFLLYYLADHPDIYEKVLKEHLDIARSKETGSLLSWEDYKKMTYSRHVLHEAFRMQSPAVGGFKQVTRDIKFGGYTIPKTWKIFWTTFEIHKDPQYFPNPDKFDPSRFEGMGPEPFTFVPFGGGPRMCPGAEYARTKILIFLHRFITKYRWEKLLPNEKITYSPGPMPMNGLPMRLFPNGTT